MDIQAYKRYAEQRGEHELSELIGGFLLRKPLNYLNQLKKNSRLSAGDLGALKKR